MTQSVSVIGMTCATCAKHVGAGLGRLPGVRSVDVDWAAGKAVLEVERELGADEISRSLEDEGYGLA